MVLITEDLLRKSAEHNEGLITSLEEVALHQRDIEKIEFLDKWCRELKILDLTSNLIPKIENLGRLKKLEYLKLGLNNIEKIENLEGCESLKKLDLTVNFIGELTSIEVLQPLVHLEEMYLTGNPCTEFDGYRNFVCATLPQLKTLDGVPIEKSERIISYQQLTALRPEIIAQQNRYKIIRKKQFEKELNKDFNSDLKIEETDDEELEKKFWNETTEYTPESRIQIHKHREEQRLKKEMHNKKKSEKVERKLVTSDGRRLNVNEPKIDFLIEEDEKENKIIIDVIVYKFLATNFIDVDVQPTYVQVTIKGKMLQLVLPEEVHVDKSTVQRSQITGHLVITMPKVRPIVSFPKTTTNISKSKEIDKNSTYLEVDENSKKVDYSNIVNSGGAPTSFSAKASHKNLQTRPNSDNFVDDPSVPDLF